MQLIKGQFEPNEAIELLTNMIHIKIKYHQRSITDGSSEEDVQTSESKIKLLQQQLYEAREYIKAQDGKLTIDTQIHLN